MNNPNIASGSSSTPNMLDTVNSSYPVTFNQSVFDTTTGAHSVSVPFQCSNACPVGPSPTQVSGTGMIFAGQPSVSAPQISVHFEQLGPRSMSTSSGPMGTNYKP